MTDSILVVDVGGTNARFAVCQPGARPDEVITYLVDDHASLEAAIRSALATLKAKPRRAAVAGAGPVDDGRIRLTNHPWQFSADGLAAAIGFEQCVVLNDFAAIAHSLPHLTPGDLQPVGGGTAEPRAPMAVLGPGTGLGVAALLPTDRGWQAVASEAGHTAFAPHDPDEAALLAEIWRRQDMVEVEQLLSGPGLLTLHAAMTGLAGKAVVAGHPTEITAEAAADPASVAARTVAAFARMLGGFAGDMALSFTARGGVFIGGGIVPHLGDLFDGGGFRRRFEAKGRFHDYVAAVPTSIITEPNPALIGLSALLAQR